MSCQGLTNVTKSGECTTGYNKGLIFFKDKPANIDIDSAQLEATWTTLADVLPSGNMNYIEFFQSEEPDFEVITEEGLGGQQIVVDQKFPISKYMVIGDACALSGIYNQFINGQIIYGFFVTSKNAIVGKLTADKESIEAIKMYVSATRMPEKSDAKGKVVLNVQPKEDYARNQVAVGISFDFDEIETVKTSFISSGAGDVSDSEITFKLWYCGRTENLDAVLTGFIVKDSLGVAVVPTGLTKTANSYVLAFAPAALSAGTYTVEYDNTVNSDYIWLPVTSVTVVA